MNRLGRQYIAPDFLKNQELQKWLADARVANDLKVLTKALIMGGAGSDMEARARLAQNYANLTGEASHLADEPIDVTVAILMAGYIASIPADQRPLAGMLQEMFESVQDRLKESSSLFEDRERLCGAPAPASRLVRP